jgi:hypothetical protein
MIQQNGRHMKEKKNYRINKSWYYARLSWFNSYVTLVQWCKALKSNDMNSIDSSHYLMDVRHGLRSNSWHATLGSINRLTCKCMRRLRTSTNIECLPSACSVLDKWSKLKAFGMRKCDTNKYLYADRRSSNQPLSIR